MDTPEKTGISHIFVPTSRRGTLIIEGIPYRTLLHPVKDRILVDPWVVTAPVPGTLVRYRVRKGQRVRKGDPVAIVNFMKMDNVLTSPENGFVHTINVTPGDHVEKGTLLIEIGPSRR